MSNWSVGKAVNAVKETHPYYSAKPRACRSPYRLQKNNFMNSSATMINFVTLIHTFGLLFLPLAMASAQPTEIPTDQRPSLQLINGGDQTIDIFWLKSDSERIPNGSVAPQQETTITTTLGHRFVIVERETKAEVTITSRVPVQGFRFHPTNANGVPDFYTQSITANGFPIVASAKVSPYALKEAAYLVNLMLAKRPDVREAMIASGARMCIMAYDEFTTDLPEFKRLRPKNYWDARARGLGGSKTDPFCSCAEENLLAYPGDPYEQECILIHEFAHNLHLRGMANVDPTFDSRLNATYDQAMAAGLWKGKYAAVNHFEYFAEGVQSWFDDNREDDHDHNHVNTREELRAYDPRLAEICEEVFGDTDLKYTKPTQRLTDHLAGYDPKQAPRFEWPERLIKAQKEIRSDAQARNATAGDTPAKRNVAGWTVHINPALLTDEVDLTDRALELLELQLKEIVRVVPAVVVIELQKVPLYFSPEYPGKPGGAEFHPDAGWLKRNGRDPQMAKGVEFSNIRIFEAETRRMPNFALHELAHAYHDLVLPGGFDHPQIIAAFERAKASGKYERVERRDAAGRASHERAYALTTPMEYFSETSEAYFSRNDFFPFTREQLQEHDPEMFALLTELWKIEEPDDN